MITTAQQFLEALDAAKPGDRVCYTTATALKSNCLVGDAARHAYLRGEVELTQRRMTGPFPSPEVGVFSYFATKRQLVWKPTPRRGARSLPRAVPTTPTQQGECDDNS